MDADLDTLATALYVRTDDLLKTCPEWAPWRPAIGIFPRISDAELVTLAVMQALLGFVSEARWLRYARAHLRHLFPYLPGQSGYNKRVRKLAATMCRLIRMLASRHEPVGRRRVAGGFHPRRVRPVKGDRTPLGPGRMRRIPLLRLPFPLFLGAAAAPAVHASRPARQFRAHRRHSRRASDSAVHPRRSRPDRQAGRAGHHRRQELLRARLRSRPRRSRPRPCSAPPARASPSDAAGSSSSRCAKSSSRSTTHSRGNLTWNATAGTPRPAYSPVSCSASSP